MQNFYFIILLHYRQVELFFPLTEFKYYKIIYMVLSGYWWAAVYLVYSKNLSTGGWTGTDWSKHTVNHVINIQRKMQVQSS